MSESFNWSTDTIVAPATPPGRGGVSIVRISGPAVAHIAAGLLRRGDLIPRMLHCCNFYLEDGAIIDCGMAVYFQSPHSFTGENLLELHCHGSRVVVDLLIQETIRLGGRLARPGEFSERAFLHGKLDLAQAEAVADLINASSVRVAKQAASALRGDFSDRINYWRQALLELQARVEGSIDFAEDEVPSLFWVEIRDKVTAVLAELQKVKQHANRVMKLHEGVSVALIGEPNAGKSTLFNRLVGRDAAIVTQIPGTTRDVLREQIYLGDMQVDLYDTAGLRADAEVIEAEGIKRAQQLLAQVDQVLFVLDLESGLKGQWESLLSSCVPARTTVVYNKIDLANRSAELVESDRSDGLGKFTAIYISAHQGVGLELLEAHLARRLQIENLGETFSIRRRHLDALDRAEGPLVDLLRVGVDRTPLEIVAEYLRQAQHALAEITGEVTSEEILGEIFSNFCVGK